MDVKECKCKLVDLEFCKCLLEEYLLGAKVGVEYVGYGCCIWIIRASLTERVEFTA